jgi:hypothetical protein
VEIASANLFIPNRDCADPTRVFPVMTQSAATDIPIKNELLHMLSLSGTLAGLCVTVVAVMNALDKSARATMVVDDLFALCALLFLICIYLIFSALRIRKLSISKTLVKSVDIIFIVAMTLMTCAAFILVYTVW